MYSLCGKYYGRYIVVCTSFRQSQCYLSFACNPIHKVYSNWNSNWSTTEPLSSKLTTNPHVKSLITKRPRHMRKLWHMRNMAISSGTGLKLFLKTARCNKVCQWLAAGRWFSPGTPVSSTNKTYRHDITEILLKVTLKTVILTLSPLLDMVSFPTV
jgi:hypothetical protein